MATRPEQTANELKVDPASLYQEEIFTDRRVGTIRRLTPIRKDGARDTARAVLYVGEAQGIVALTGAGISTDSGIPDFRGPQGVWTRNPLAEKMSNIHCYLADAQVRKASWQNRLGSPAWSAQPNAGHLSLVELERAGKLHALITQNIDELHQIAGNSPGRVIEVHGSMRRFMCWGCGMRGPMQ